MELATLFLAIATICSNNWIDTSSCTKKKMACIEEKQEKQKDGSYTVNVWKISKECL